MSSTLIITFTNDSKPKEERQQYDFAVCCNSDVHEILSSPQSTDYRAQVYQQAIELYIFPTLVTPISQFLFVENTQKGHMEKQPLLSYIFFIKPPNCKVSIFVILTYCFHFCLDLDLAVIIHEADQLCLCH